MSNAIAFFPWVFIEEPMTIGPLRLLPYVNMKQPGDLPNVSQDDIDGVFGAYSNRPKFPLGRGALLELGDWNSGMKLTPEILEKLFRAKEILAYAALSNRVLLCGHFDYTNSDAYALVVQRYKPGETRIFSFNTRRRDGGATHIWSSGAFSFHRPNHVDSSWKVAVDELLVKTLLELPSKEEGIYEAIVEFNSANTDSSNVPDHVEVVMCKSAFEWLLEIDEKRGSFFKTLNLLLPEDGAIVGSGPLTTKWLERWKPDDSRILLAWAMDFCAVRGSAAHGKEKPNSFVWGNAQHLAFISILFPLLLKKVLANKGLIALSDHDEEHLRHVEGYLQHDPFSPEALDAEERHAWAEVRQRSRMKVFAKGFFSSMDTGD